MSVESDVRTYLAAAFSNERVFMGGVRMAEPPAIPHRGIWVLESGGPPPMGYMDGGAGTAWRPTRVLVRIRGNAKEYASTKTLAEAVWEALWAARISTYHVRCEQGAPLYMGRDALEHEEFVIAVRIEYKA